MVEQQPLLYHIGLQFASTGSPKGGLCMTPPERLSLSVSLSREVIAYLAEQARRATEEQHHYHEGSEQIITREMVASHFLEDLVRQMIEDERQQA